MINRSFNDRITLLKQQQPLTNAIKISSAKTTEIKAATIRIFKLKDISSSEVRKLLSDLPSAGSAGIDTISASMLKFIPDELSTILAKLFNMFVVRHKFPTQWKAAVITPVYKKSNKADINNYRPISILPLVSKIFEKTIDWQFRKFLEEEGLLSNAQHGLQKSRSCQTALLSQIGTLFTNRLNKQHSLLASIYYSKASDMLDHQISLKKLATLNISEHAIDWFSFYFSKRHQCIKYNGTLSSYEQVVYGVPQGSILEPTLYTVYVNDLLHALPDSSTIAYADDFTITTAGSSIERHSFLCKTCWLPSSLGLSRTHCNLTYQNISLCSCHSRFAVFNRQRTTWFKPTNEQQLTLLGIVIFSDLSWLSHSRLIPAKMSSRLGAIQQFGRCLYAKACFLVYNAFVWPHLNYYLPVWRNTNTEVLTCYLRAISGSHASTFSRNTFNSYNICDFVTQVFVNNALILFITFYLPTERRVFNPVTLTSSCHTQASSSNKLLLTNINRIADHYCFNSYAPAQWNT